MRTRRTWSSALSHGEHRGSPERPGCGQPCPFTSPSARISLVSQTNVAPSHTQLRQQGHTWLHLGHAEHAEDPDVLPQEGQGHCTPNSFP